MIKISTATTTTNEMMYVNGFQNRQRKWWYIYKRRRKLVELQCACIEWENSVCVRDKESERVRIERIKEQNSIKYVSNKII